MCIVNFHFHNHSKYKLILVANRDEFYERPTKPAHYWEDEPNILAGRDLRQMGTWLGITKEGKFAAITNFRDPSLPVTGRYSRGEIIRNFLTNDIQPDLFINGLIKERQSYGGYNVILGDSNGLYHYNNVLDESKDIKPGTHSLSNHSLDTPWPKVAKAKTRLNEYVQTNPLEVNINDLFNLVSDRSMAHDDELPHTGVGLEMERLLSPIFIKIPNYGTRSSSVLLIDKNNHVTFVERTFHEGEFQFDKRFEFAINR
ncbi:NRDE family protein [Rummeliibacillus pycnus]|uniref:NRDE family protein n=1 Tax=Rummeliibacillus pycnus TaxID=101070 RepID=UPI003D299CBB